MRVTFLGTGTSHGVPQIGCGCAVCQSADPRNNRLRPSVLVEAEGTSLLIDAAPDFRAQALRAGLRHIDAVLLTHGHADHMLGLDDLRVFTAGERRLPIYGSGEALAAVERVFPYACTAKPCWPGVPQFDLRPLAADAALMIGGIKVRPLPVTHARLTVYGFLMADRLAYVTDCNIVPPEVIRLLADVPVLVLDGLRHRPHIAHLTVAEAVAVAAATRARRTWLTHVCHELEHAQTEAELPAGVRVAYDGLQLEIGERETRVLD